MERIWIKHWPPGLEQSRIRLPMEAATPSMLPP